MSELKATRAAGRPRSVPAWQCPHCKGWRTSGWGKKHGRQTYRCEDCGKRSTDGPGRNGGRKSNAEG